MQIVEIKSEAQQCLVRSQKSLEAQEEEYQQIKAKLQREQDEICNAIVATLDILTAYKEFISDSLLVLHKSFAVAHQQAMMQ